MYKIRQQSQRYSHRPKCVLVWVESRRREGPDSEVGRDEENAVPQFVCVFYKTLDEGELNKWTTAREEKDIAGENRRKRA